MPEQNPLQFVGLSRLQVEGSGMKQNIPPVIAQLLFIAFDAVSAQAALCKAKAQMRRLPAHAQPHNIAHIAAAPDKMCIRDRLTIDHMDEEKRKNDQISFCLLYTSKRPVIGMVEMGSDPFRRYMKNKYLHALFASGSSPVMLADTADQEALRRDFASCDGLLLPGGADISPSLYGENAHTKCGKPNATRDLSEPFLLALALEQGKPVLGICRGCQLLNVALGGSLWQDISEMEDPHPGHMAFLRRARHVHNAVSYTHLDVYKRQADICPPE